MAKQGRAYPSWLFPEARGHQGNGSSTAHRTPFTTLIPFKRQQRARRGLWHRRYNKIPGARVWLLCDGDNNFWHTGADGPEFYCEREWGWHTGWHRVLHIGRWKSALPGIRR